MLFGWWGGGLDFLKVVKNLRLSFLLRLLDIGKACDSSSRADDSDDL